MTECRHADMYSGISLVRYGWVLAIYVPASALPFFTAEPAKSNFHGRRRAFSNGVACGSIMKAGCHRQTALGREQQRGRTVIAKHTCSKEACFRQRGSGAGIGNASVRMPANRCVHYHKGMLAFSKGLRVVERVAPTCVSCY